MLQYFILSIFLSIIIFIYILYILFLSAGASDMTQHRDPIRKQRYIDRHKKNENWNDYMSAGSLSRWILWNKTTLQASISDYKSKFNLK